ncbi:MAG: hypothetical protein WCC04_02835 [Terriglobales bacterium]
MSTIWKTTKANNNTFTGTTLSSWSRQQKLAMIGGFALLGILLAVSACSKQSQKSALVGVSSAAPNSLTVPATAPQTMSPQTPAAAAAIPPIVAKRSPAKRAANVSYTDANSGLSFIYPRKFALATGAKAQPQFDADVVPMNFVHPGGATVATVALPKTLYPGTDFATGFFTVNVNRSLSEEECSHFAFIDMSNADGEPIDAEKVQVGSSDMEMTSEFSGSATRQAEAQYYHKYENGACYEYVLGLGTAGYGTSDGVAPVNRDGVFARLEKILTTVKIHPVATEQASVQAVIGGEPAK